MTGSERRDQIIKRIQESQVPVSGTQLAKEYEVSRQVIVQDIALIRAAGHKIISTNRGYILNASQSAAGFLRCIIRTKKLRTSCVRL